jgi:2,3-bisphosphoglycerate-independent phosphoglycerate mutase
MERKKVVLVIFDGWGIAQAGPGNAIEAAKKPFFDSLLKEYPHAKLQASGGAVGLPDGEMGNSEVGHLTIGAGTPADTDVVRINKSISEKTFHSNEVVQKLFAHVKKHNSTLHVQSLVSAGGVHSHINHLFAFLEAAKDAGITKIAIHAFTDGRDTPPQSAVEYLDQLDHVLKELGVGVVASIAGRYYAMDRDNNWDRIARVMDAMFECKGDLCEKLTPVQYIENLYKQGKTDEHLEPIVFKDANGKTYPIQKDDGVIFLNFRADRARQLSRKVSEKVASENLCFVTMTEHEKNEQNLVAFPPQTIHVNLASEVSKAGLSQAHVAETEKYAHVTYFLNGGNEEPYPGEQRVLVESRKDVATHDQAPEMKAKEIATETCKKIQEGVDFVALNFANPDMVGHTANYNATVTAIETVDDALKMVVEEASKYGYVMFITADHGNAEAVKDADGNPVTAHTTNPVPGIITSKEVTLHDGGLADVAPTVLQLLGIQKPNQMSGKSLID